MNHRRRFMLDAMASMLSATPLAAHDLNLLEQASADQGVRAALLVKQPKRDNLLDYVVQRNTAQVNDRAFVDELITWIRFNDTEAVEKGDGLNARAVRRFSGHRPAAVGSDRAFRALANPATFAAAAHGRRDCLRLAIA